MGNSQSSNLSANNSPQHVLQVKGLRSGTASPVPGESKSFRSHRKKSIDLPDLQDNPYKDRSFSGMKTAPLPIPVSDERIARKVNQADYAVQPSTHMDHFNKNRSNGVGSGQPTAPTRGRPPKGQGAEPSSRVPSRGRGSQYMHYIPSNLSSAIFPRPGAPPPSRNHSPTPPPQILDANVTSSPEGISGTSALVDEGPQEIVVTSSIPLGFDDPYFAVVDGGSDGDAHVVVQELDVIQGVNGDEVLIKISWHGEGQTVFLVVESDNTWNGRKQMDLETSAFPISSPVFPPTSAPTSPPTEVPRTSTNVFSTTLSLRPDTHHLRFLVDDEWRIADNLPTAVDSTSALANYLIVGTLPPQSEASINGAIHRMTMKPRLGLLTITRGIVLPVTASNSTNATTTPNIQSTPPTPGSPLLHVPHTNRHGLSLGAMPTGTHGRIGHHNKPGMGLGYSFWSASSSNDMEAVEVVEEKGRRIADYHGRKRRSPPPPMQMPIGKVHYTPQWTTEIPLELVEAAQEEEKFLEHQTQVRTQMQDRGQHQTHHVSGFIPLPNIPPAPKLPRHLEKLILNSMGAHTRSGGGNSTSGHSDKEKDGRRRDKDRDKERDKRSAAPTPTSSNNSSAIPLPVTTASGTNITDAHSTHRTHQQRPTHPASDRDAPPPPSTGQPPVTAVTAAAISTTSGPKRIATSEDNTALIADDCSVLPVPSHVVLHHLTTSAIKNGVLAVAQTGRYRKKFVTTVYYKPT